MITISTMKENSHVYKSKYLTLSQKIRHFRVFAECIFLYNCELWTTTKTINDSIDAFHRRQDLDLTRFNKIAIQGTPQMAVD